MKCPKCGSHRLYDILQWDTNVGYECDKCGYSWRIGYVEGPPGDHYFVPCIRHPEEYDDTEEVFEPYAEVEEIADQGTIEEYVEDEEDDIPF